VPFKLKLCEESKSKEKAAKEKKKLKAVQRQEEAAVTKKRKTEERRIAAGAKGQTLRCTACNKPFLTEGNLKIHRESNNYPGNNKKQKIKGSWQDVNRGWYTPTPSDASNTATTTSPSPGAATLSTPPQEGESGDTRQVVLVAKRIVAKEKLVCAAVRMGWARKIPAPRCSTEVLARRAAWVKQYYNASLLKSLRANEYLAARQMKMEF